MKWATFEVSDWGIRQRQRKMEFQLNSWIYGVLSSQLLDLVISWSEYKIMHYVIVLHTDNAALPSIDHKKLYLISVGFLIQVSPHLIIHVVVILCYIDYVNLVNLTLWILKHEWILLFQCWIWWNWSVSLGMSKEILCQISSYGTLNQTSHNHTWSLVSAAEILRWY